MTPEEIRILVEKTVNNTTKYYWVYLLVSIVINFGVIYLFEYSKSKGQNLATKQDIAEITKKIEEVKAGVQNNQEIEKQKRELKYNALLQSLNIIDAYLSHLNFPLKEGEKITKQYASIEEVRTCHNNLILTVDNPKILELFMNILHPKRNGDKIVDNLMIRIEEYRNLVRNELGYGNLIYSDTVNTWMGSVIFEKN